MNFSLKINVAGLCRDFWWLREFSFKYSALKVPVTGCWLQSDVLEVCRRNEMCSCLLCPSVLIKWLQLSVTKGEKMSVGFN